MVAIVAHDPESIGKRTRIFSDIDGPTFELRGPREESKHQQPDSELNNHLQQRC